MRGRPASSRLAGGPYADEGEFDTRPSRLSRCRARPYEMRANSTSVTFFRASFM